MDFEEYRREGRSRYADFVEAICHILKAALDSHSLVAHTITGRAKVPESLRKKLADRGIDHADAIDEHIKDLAGCRIVFLTNSQVNAFNNTAILHENFEVLDVNVHHPVPGTDTETKLFDSTNYFVQLKPERLVLPEYRVFQGLRAEIQVQTLLNHAWAEMGHDTIYKEPELKALGKARMAAIGERMDKVMRDHLLPAGHDFDKIARDFGRLLKADKVAEETIEAIRNADNNNQLEDVLKTFTDLVLPHFDNPAAEFLNNAEALIAAVERSRGYDVVPIETQFGDLPGKSSIHVAQRVAQLLSGYRYCDPALTFGSLVRLYHGAKDDGEREVWLDVATKFSAHNLDVWQKYGPAVQQVILDELQKLGAPDIEGCLSLLVAMLGNVLSSEVEGTTWRSDSVTIHQGSVRVSDVLREQRREAIDWLERWLDQAKTDECRRLVLDSLRKSACPPFGGNYDDALVLAIMEDSARVQEIIRERASSWGLELRRWCEVDALHWHHRFRALPSTMIEKPELVTAQQALVGALLELRDLLNADEDYRLYKTLIGYDSVRPEAWEKDAFDYEATEAWRRASFPDIIAKITEDTVDVWIKTVDHFVEQVGSDGGNLTPMRECFTQLAVAKPHLVLIMLDNMTDHRATFLASMLRGLEEGGCGEETTRRINTWIDAGQFLRAIGDYLRFRPHSDRAQLRSYILRAIELGDEISVHTAAIVAAAWYDKVADLLLVDDIFMAAIRFFSEKSLPHWVQHFCTPSHAKILTGLSEGQLSELLASFVKVDTIGYSAVRILASVGRSFPQLVIDFFDSRIQRDRGETGVRFEPIPYHLHDLPAVLSYHTDLLLPAVRRWYEQEPDLHQYRGGRLFQHAFPILSEDVAQQLTQLARDGDETDLKFILETLVAYEGHEQIYPLCMDVVDRLELNDKLLMQVSRVLGETGVLVGEFGHVEAYTQRRNLINRWHDDPRPKVQAFAHVRAREIEQSMAWEQRRAERDIEQRRRDWGEA